LTSGGAPIIAVTCDFDQFTGFLHWRELFRGIVAAGGVPLAVDCGKERTDVSRIIGDVDGLLISGGVDVNPALYGGIADDPRIQGINERRDDNELEALERARATGKPVLAICRGAQLTNVALGGTLYADLARDWMGLSHHWQSEEALIRTLHKVNVEPGSLLAKWMMADGLVAVNSRHHQGIRTLTSIGRATAHTDDGLIEAFEIEAERIVCVQWHPEVLWGSEQHAFALLSNFVHAAGSKTVRR
jgi:putative glutamine amidotransferase